MPFQKYNPQLVVGSDPISQLNWQDFADKTKGGQFTPTLSGISSSGPALQINAYYYIMGPLVFLSISISTSPSNALQFTASPTLTLPANAFITPSGTVLGQIIPCRVLAGTVVNGMATITSINVLSLTDFASLINQRSLLIQGFYLRN